MKPFEEQMNAEADNYMGEHKDSRTTLALSSRYAFEAGFQSCLTFLRSKVDATELPKRTTQELMVMLLDSWDVDNDNQQAIIDRDNKIDEIQCESDLRKRKNIQYLEEIAGLTQRVSELEELQKQWEPQWESNAAANAAGYNQAMEKFGSENKALKDALNWIYTVTFMKGVFTDEGVEYWNQNIRPLLVEKEDPK